MMTMVGGSGNVVNAPERLTGSPSPCVRLLVFDQLPYDFCSLQRPSLAETTTHAAVCPPLAKHRKKKLGAFRLLR